jgi:Caspase domain/Curli production assembly/transport component CsgG/WD domain, G-beta repeat
MRGRFSSIFTYWSITALTFALLTAAVRLQGQTELFSYSLYRTLSVSGERLEVNTFSADGKFLAIGTKSGKVGLLDISPNGSPKWLAQHSGSVLSVTFDRIGSQLASGGEDGIVRVIDLDKERTRELRGHKGKVWSLAYTPEGDLLASAGEDRNLIIWDPKSGKELYRLTNGGNKPLKYVAFNGIGTTVTAVGESGIISEWDVKNRMQLRQIKESDLTVVSAAMNFSGTHLSVGTEVTGLPKGGVLNSGARVGELYREERIKVYDLETGKVAKTLDGIQGQPTSLSLSADGRYIAVTRLEIKTSFVGVYDLQRGIEIASLPVREGTTAAVAFSPDGRWLSSVAENGEISVMSVKGVQAGASVGDLAGVKYQITSPRDPLIRPGTNLAIAVMDLDAQEIEPGVARSVSDMLRNRIAGTSAINLVDRKRIDQILKEQELQNSGRTDSALAVRVGKILNVQKMIFGGVSRLGTSMTISAQMLDVETARIDGIREILCQKCALEDLPGAIAALKPVLIADSAQANPRAVAPPSRPRIDIAAPVQNSAAQNDKVVVKADVQDESGIKSAELLINGGFESSQKISLMNTGAAVERSLKIDREVTLDSGSNILTLRIENVAGIIEEESRIVRLPTAATTANKPAASGKRWALVIGISKYKDTKIPMLEFADKDAQAFSDALSTTELGGFSADRKLVLLNEQATTASVTRALRSFLQKPDVDDTVVIYLAGHGAPDPKRPDNVYFITHDTEFADIAGTALPMREIEIALKENLVARRVVVLTDSCHSGAIGGDASRRDLVYTPSESVNRTLDEMVKRAKPGTAIFTSARSGESSLEGSKWGGGHGVYTWFLLRGLQGAADTNKDGIITLDELFSFVRDSVKAETGDQQHPVVVSDAYDPHLPIAVISGK